MRKVPPFQQNHSQRDNLPQLSWKGRKPFQLWLLWAWKKQRTVLVVVAWAAAPSRIETQLSTELTREQNIGSSIANLFKHFVPQAIFSKLKLFTEASYWLKKMQKYDIFSFYLHSNKLDMSFSSETTQKRANNCRSKK